MSREAPRKSWILRKKQVTVTTWRFRLLIVLALAACIYLSYPSWLVAIGNTLLHREELQPADLILLDNFNPKYEVYAKAEELVEAGYATRVLAPVRIEGDPQADAVEKGIASVMGQTAGIQDLETLPVHHTEPVSLNVARQIADFLQKEGIHSVLVVSPGFRSSRSYLVYNRVFSARGVHVECVAAPGSTADGWWHTWHGVQDAGLEFSKLLYYKLWVLR